MHIKFNYHSLVDVITNSSTTIYTNSDGCVGPAKELIQEFLKTMNIDKDVNDIFYFDSFMDKDYYLDDLGEIDDEEVDELLQKIASKEIEKPQWMIGLETQKSEDDECGYDSELYIFPKEEKYEKLAKALKRFLYSTDHEAIYI
jgi:hypothetical protein